MTTGFWKQVNTRRNSPREPTETDRILELPCLVGGKTGDYIEGEDDPQTVLGLEGGTHRLHQIQQDSLSAIRKNKGAFLPIGVGFGKSWIACLSGAILDRELTIVLAPASTIVQLQRTYDELCGHYRLRPAKILSYSVLSQPSGTALLDELIGDLPDNQVALVLDEAHLIKRQESARTMRVMRFCAARKDVAVIAMSGTMTSKSVRDMAHISWICLGAGSPLPNSEIHVRRWAECLDADGQPTSADWQWLEPLGIWNGTPFSAMRGAMRKRTARIAFQNRLRSTPGVVASKEGSLGTSLRIHLVTDIKVPTAVSDLLIRIADDGIDPQGCPITSDIDAWRHSRNVLVGFWYRWVWPGGVEDRAWLDARNDWNRFVRLELEKYADAGYDSPFLVSQRIQKEIDDNTQRYPIHIAWVAWSAQKHKKPPPVEPVWVDAYIIDYAVNWLRKNKEGIVWYSSAAVAAALASRGITVYGAGDDPPRENHPCAMSIKAQGTGIHLVEWSVALVLEPMGGGRPWEQLLGRHHRNFQLADTVTFSILAHGPAGRDILRTAKEDARYFEDMSGSQAKLNIADYS